MNQPDPVAEAERVADCSTGNDGEACGEVAEGLPREDGFSPEEAPTPQRADSGAEPGPASLAADVPRARRRRRPAAALPRAAEPTGRELVASVLFAIQTAEAYREKTGRYGRGAEYLRMVPTGGSRRNLATGINRAVELGLIRLELRPVPSKIRRFFASKRAKTNAK